MDNEKLIELVKGYPFLYDPNDKRYYDNSQKDAAWEQISRKLKLPDKDCRRCWALLRDGFRRAIKTENQAQNGQRKQPFRRWRYVDNMSFLLSFMTEKSHLHKDFTKSELANDCDKNFESEDFKCLIDYPLNDLSSDNFSTGTNHPPPELIPNIRKRKVIRQKPARRGNVSSSLMKYLMNRKNGMDDTEQFFASLATTVRSFPLRERAIAKARVFQVVSAMEIELLSDPTPTRCSTPDLKPFCTFDPSNEPISE